MPTSSSSSSKTMRESDCETRVNRNSQGELFAEIGTSHADKWQSFLRVFSEEVHRVGLKKMAGEIDEKSSDISNAISERDRHYVRGEWVIWLLANGPTDEVLKFLAALRGRDVVAPEVLTPEEELSRTKTEMVKHFGPAGAALIRKGVFSR